MKLILCADDRNGLSFGGKRQSRDRAVCDKIRSLTAEGRLWMNEYSAKLFSDPDEISVCPDCLKLAGENDWCFAENLDVTPYLPSVRMLVVFNWNRHYPADLYLTLPEGLCCIRKEDFPGNSHEKITMEVYVR